MRERPIIFSAPMVRAILADTKVQTRRVVSDRHIPEVADHKTRTLRKVKPLAHECPYGHPGDRLWARETWAVRQLQAGHWLEYRADAANLRTQHRNAAGSVLPSDSWKPSIFMPRWASRLNLEILNVRVERVQGISEADAMAEGCESRLEWRPMPGEALWEPDYEVTARDDFKQLWDGINAKRGYGWAANPWVWVITFQRG